MKIKRSKKKVKKILQLAPWKYVGVTEFCRLLGVQKNTWYNYLKKGKVEYCGVNENGDNVIDYVKMLNRVIEISNNPNYYSPDHIVKRRVNKGDLSPDDANAELLRRRQMESRGEVAKLEKTNFHKPKDDSPSEFSNDMDKRQAETVKQVYQAKQARVKYYKEIGALTDTKLFMDQAVQIATVCRKNVMGVVPRVKQIFATMSDPTEIGNYLEKELTYALSKLKFDFEGIKKNSKLNEIDNQKDFLEAYEE